MKKSSNYNIILDKLTNDMRFGLFNKGQECYFEDGQKVSYTELWSALRELRNLPIGHHLTLTKLCPNTFIGTFSYTFSKHKWKAQ